MNRIELIQQKGISPEAGETSISLFGKGFSPVSDSKNNRIILHADFPLLNDDDLTEFIAYAKTIEKVVVSGRRANIHPYRLMYIDEKGFDAFCVDISQKIRGNRHLYPEVYQFVPALVSIPPSMNMESALDSKNLDMYILPEEKLLDQSILIENLLIKAIRS
jgi:hypothetical protein